MCDRNSAIELYRMMLMFGICVLHALGIKDHRWAVYSLLFLVDAFVFITGYYGVTLTRRRLFSLSINVVYCLWVAGIFNKVFYGEDILKTMSTIWSTMWFVHAYFLLLMFAPLINFIFENCSLKKCLTLLTPILVAVFGWGWLSTVPIIRRIIPVQNGLVAYSGITLIGVYIIARMVRISNIEKKIPMWITIVLFVISLAFAPLGLARYNSPIAVIMAFTSFTIFNSLRIPDWFGKRLILIGPSLFSVYLLHSNEAVGFRIIRVIIEWCNTGIAGCFVAAASVFVGCIILDIPRRVICSRIVMKCCKKA